MGAATMTVSNPAGDVGPESWTRKLSPEAKQLASATVANQSVSRQGLREANVLVRTTREVSTADRARLESIGATVRTVAGDVLTACIPIDRLEVLAGLDVVAYVELSRPLRSERPSGDEERPAGEPKPPDYEEG
jgi:hypothetical protein